MRVLINADRWWWRRQGSHYEALLLHDRYGIQIRGGTVPCFLWSEFQACETWLRGDYLRLYFPIWTKDAILDAIMVFSTSLPSNTTPSDIEIKYAFKCADGSGSWAGLSNTRGSPEKWRRTLKATNPCELGVFDISSMNSENTCREFPYSSQMTQNATSATQVSVEFNTHQAVFDAPPTLAVS